MGIITTLPIQISSILCAQIPAPKQAPKQAPKEEDPFRFTRMFLQYSQDCLYIISEYNLKPTGDPDGSLYEPGYKGKYYKIGGDRLLFINGKGEHWIFGYHSGEKGERSVWNKASNSGRGATGSW